MPPTSGLAGGNGGRLAVARRSPLASLIAGGRRGLGLGLELAKIRITALVAVTTAMGAILFAGSARAAMLAPVLGVLLLACGSAALNHVQERDLDARMARTRRRPIPSGRISVGGALLWAAALAGAGALILALATNSTALALGLLALFWYNAIYTPLKRRTAFAVLPGSLIGALPPIIGWTAAGGSPLDSQALGMGAFLFIWQVPHFWLLLLVYGREYSAAGLPSLTSLFSPAQLSRMTFAWMLATAAACLLLPWFGVVEGPAFLAGLWAACAWLVWKSRALLAGAARPATLRAAFHAINLFALAVIALVVAGALV